MIERHESSKHNHESFAPFLIVVDFLICCRVNLCAVKKAVAFKVFKVARIYIGQKKFCGVVALSVGGEFVGTHGFIHQFAHVI